MNAYKKILNGIAFTLIFACSSSQKTSTSIDRPYQLPSSSQILSPELTVKTLIAENKLAIDYESSSQVEGAKEEAEFFLSQLQNTKNTYQQAVEQTCQKFASGALCRTKEKSEYFKSPSISRQRLSNSERLELQKNITTANFSAIQQSPETIISAMSRLSKSAISNALASILKSEACYSTSLYYAAGYAAESLLPGEEPLSLILSVYKKAVSCGNDDASARAAFRLALFEISENHCNEAAPLFEKVLTQEALKPLHSRSLYWSMRCKSGDTAVLDLAEKTYLLSPLSFHGLLGLQEAGIELFDRIQKNAEPLVVSRSLHNQMTNQVLRVAEYAIAANQKRAAKNLILSLQFDELYQESPELAIYVSYLFHRIDEGLFKFQTLASVLSRNPQLKTPTTMKLFYPKWQYDIVEKYAKEAKLDPYLVMALIRQESAFHTNARSGARAMGLMQVLPSTARTVDRKVSRTQLFDPEINVRIGTQYMARALKRFDGDIHMMLAAYNAGGGIVSTWMKRYPTKDALVFSDLIPYRETREYVGSIMRNYYWYKALYENSDVSLRPTTSLKKDIAPDLTPQTLPMVDVIPPVEIEEEEVSEEMLEEAPTYYEGMYP